MALMRRQAPLTIGLGPYIVVLVRRANYLTSLRIAVRHRPYVYRNLSSHRFACSWHRNVLGLYDVERGWYISDRNERHSHQHMNMQCMANYAVRIAFVKAAAH